MIDKLQIDAVAVVAYAVVLYSHVVTLPAVDGVAHDRVVGDVARDVVVRHHAVLAVLNHDAELVGPEHAVAHRQGCGFKTLDATIVDARRAARVAQLKSVDGHSVGSYLDDVAPSATVNDRHTYTLQPHATPDDQVLAVDLAGMDVERVAVACRSESAADRLVGFALSDVEPAPTHGERNEQEEQRQVEDV